MSDYERGPLRSYEIQWMSGHIETIRAHQVLWPNSFGALTGGPDKPRRVNFHGEVDGQWTLVLSALEDDIRTIRDVTEAERPA